jgi:predicted ester cyclase
MVLAEIEDLAFMRLLDKQTKVGEVFGIPVNGKSKAEIKKEISRRKARPNPHGKK